MQDQTFYTSDYGCTKKSLQHIPTQFWFWTYIKLDLLQKKLKEKCF